VGNNAAGLDIVKAALDALDNLELALDIGGNGFAGEEGFAAPCIHDKAAEFLDYLGAEPYRHCGAGGHGGQSCACLYTK